MRYLEYGLPPIYYSPDARAQGADLYGPKEQPVQKVLQFFDAIEQDGKRIPGRDVLQERLEEVKDGKRVIFAAFNCIKFAYQQGRDGEYPQAFPLIDATSTAGFYRDGLMQVANTVSAIGNADFRIIIPDNEFDANVMNLSASVTDQIEYVKRTRNQLRLKFSGTPYRVSTLSELCYENGLPSPWEFTKRNREKVKETGLKTKTIKGSRDYFTSYDLPNEYVQTITNDTIRDRLEWYFGMYAGEGELFNTLGAVVINIEDDRRVATWQQRGASGFSTDEKLPIVTPVNTRAFKGAKDK